MRVFALARLSIAAFVLAREGVFALFPVEEMPPPVRFAVATARLLERRHARATSAAGRFTRAFNRLGPSYVKLGQFLATRPDVVGREAARDLADLQDRVPPLPDAIARAAVEEALGRPVEKIFVEFGPAVAAASIAQVHRATVLGRDGEPVDVAVKVLRPGVDRRFAQDLEGFYLAARAIERFVAPARRLRPVAVVDTLARSVSIEMDLRLEAAALSEMAENTRDDPGFALPGVDWRHSAKTVLTMDWIEGIRMSEVDRLAAAGHDLEALAATLIQSFLRQAVRDGFFHADMHQGNLFVVPDGRIVAVDLGITGRLDKAERRFLAEILFGFIRRDYRRVAEVHFEAGYVPATQDVDLFAQALRAIGEPIRDQTAREISMARLLTQLFEVTELFAMHTQPRLIMLQKTMVVVEGVGRSLDPELDMWRIAEPVVGEWMARNLGPLGRIEQFGQELAATGRALAALPTLTERLERVATARAVQPIPRPVAVPFSIKAGLWVVALALAAIAVALLID